MNNDIYSLTSGKFLENLYAVDNMLIKQLATVSLQEANNLRMVQFIQNNILSDKDEVGEKLKSGGNKSIINLCKLPALREGLGFKTLAEDIANYRVDMLSFDFIDGTFAKKHEELLVADYLLSACVCYVEVFDGSSKVQKFFATRNRYIAGGVSGLQPNETTKYINYLAPLKADYELANLRVLKLNLSKGQFKIVQPRSGLSFGTCNIRVTPLFLMMGFLNGVTPILKDSIVKFKYVKDNYVEREMVSTLSRKILLDYYGDADLIDKVLGRCETRIEYGFMRLPELGISRYDEMGVRSLNLSRITSIEVIESVDRRYIDVDFSKIMPYFKQVVESTMDINVLAMIYEDLNIPFEPSDDLLVLRELLLSNVDGRYAIGTNTFLRELHNIMVANEYIFKDYNGGLPKASDDYEVESFDLGCL